MSEKPIVEMRALDFSWVEVSVVDQCTAERRNAWRIQVRREGETEWTTIEAIPVAGPPEDEVK